MATFSAPNSKRGTSILVSDKPTGSFLKRKTVIYDVSESGGKLSIIK